MIKYKFNNNGLTLDKLFDQSLIRRPEGTLKDLSSKTTYEDFYDDIFVFSSAIHQLIGSGNVISVMGWNNIDFTRMLYSIPLSGNIIHPVDVRQPVDQIMQTMKEAGTRYVFSSMDFLPLVEVLVSKNLIDSKNVMITDKESNEEFTSFHDKISRLNGSEPPVLEESAIASILFTSGTTGKPKGVKYHHRDMILSIWAMLTNLSAFPGPARLTSEDRMMSLIPFFHLWSWGTAFMSTLIGADYIMGGKFDSSKTLEIVRKEKVTWMSMVPTMFNALAVTDSGNPFKKIKILIGGSAIPSSIINYASSHEIELTSIYGFTDGLGAAIGTTNDCQTPYREECLHKAIDSITPLVFTRYETEGEKSEIKFRAPWIPLEYFNLKEESAGAYRNGYFYPGDAGVIFQGGIKITDRIKDLIKSGGEFIPSAELEYHISNLPEILDVAVIGYPDEKWVERPVVIYRTKPNLRVDEEKIRNHLMSLVDKGAIKKWWIPDHYIEVNNMPMTGTGKIDKKELRNLVKDKIGYTTKH